MGNVESLNRQLGRLFNGYMNKVEEKTGKPCKNWTDIVGVVRTKLNAARKKTLPDDINEHEYPVPQDTEKIGKTEYYKRIKPKYQVGQHVYRYLDHPTNALGKKQPTAARREGDYNWSKDPKEIVQIITMGGRGPVYRYILVSTYDNNYTCI
eukprot:scaffold7211_cov247-Ochromonas_danica.AAC.14